MTRARDTSSVVAVDAYTAKTSLVDTDELSLVDSATAFTRKKITWANIKATLVAIFFGFITQATANSTKTLTVTSHSVQEFTGTTAGQIVAMPDVTTLYVGWNRRISNKSTQSIAVNSSGGNLIYTVPAATDWLFTCALITGTTAASWSNSYAGASAVPTSASGLVLINATDFSAVASVSLPTNSFSATYKNYRVIFDIQSSSVNAALTVRKRIAGTDTTGATYNSGGFIAPNTGATSQIQSTGATSWATGISVNLGPAVHLILDVIQPLFVGGDAITVTGDISPAAWALILAWGGTSTTAYDSLSFLMASGNMTGSVRVYGYAN